MTDFFWWKRCNNSNKPDRISHALKLGIAKPLYLGWGHDAERVHDAVWILLAYLWDKQSTHAWSCAAAQGVSQLEALEAVAVLRFSPQHVHHSVHQLCSFGVVALGPIVTFNPIMIDFSVVMKVIFLVKR